MLASGMPLVLVEKMEPGLRCFDQGALDLQLFGDGFHDPIAVAYLGEVVFEIAGCDE